MSTFIGLVDAGLSPASDLFVATWEAYSARHGAFILEPGSDSLHVWQPEEFRGIIDSFRDAGSNDGDILIVAGTHVLPDLSADALADSLSAASGGQPVASLWYEDTTWPAGLLAMGKAAAQAILTEDGMPEDGSQDWLVYSNWVNIPSWSAYEPRAFYAGWQVAPAGSGDWSPAFVNFAAENPAGMLEAHHRTRPWVGAVSGVLAPGSDTIVVLQQPGENADWPLLRSKLRMVHEYLEPNARRLVYAGEDFPGWLQGAEIVPSRDLSVVLPEVARCCPDVIVIPGDAVMLRQISAGDLSAFYSRGSFASWARNASVGSAQRGLRAIGRAVLDLENLGITEIEHICPRIPFWADSELLLSCAQLPNVSSMTGNSSPGEPASVPWAFLYANLYGGSGSSSLLEILSYGNTVLDRWFSRPQELITGSSSFLDHDVSSDPVVRRWLLRTFNNPSPYEAYV